MYFSAYINSPKDDSYLIFQTTGRAGIKTVFAKFLESSVFPKFPHLVFRITPYWPKALLAEYKKGNVNYVTLRSRKTLSDASDYKFGKNTLQEYEVETKIRPIRRKRIKRDKLIPLIYRRERTLKFLTSHRMKVFTTC